MSRYRVVGSAAECEPGSNDLVLSNRLGIKDPAVMEGVERDLLLDLYQTIIGNGAPTNRLRISDLIGWHRQWLGSVYSWAGKVRTFNLSKQGFAFASAHLLPDLLKSFESEYLVSADSVQPRLDGCTDQGTC